MMPAAIVYALLDDEQRGALNRAYAARRAGRDGREDHDATWRVPARGPLPRRRARTGAGS